MQWALALSGWLGVVLCVVLLLRLRLQARTSAERLVEVYDDAAKVAEAAQRLVDDVHKLTPFGTQLAGAEKMLEAFVATTREREKSLQSHAKSLGEHVSDALSAIEETTFSSSEVSRNIGELSQSAKETAAAMSAMDRSIGEVETNANETSRLTAQVSADAERGVAALAQTITGIDKIRDNGRISAEVIGSLGQRIGEVGNILNVIDDVAEQTNLLALNAAIIAAQAGEHGRGFAVVADEIKALAERTGSSTKEIAELIGTIEAQSQRATDVMAQGYKTMEEGVQLGHNAQSALHNIVTSAKQSTSMMQVIANSTVEQAKASKQVTNSIGHVANAVQQLFFASAEQARGYEHIGASATHIRASLQTLEQDLAANESIDGIEAGVIGSVRTTCEYIGTLDEKSTVLGRDIERSQSPIRSLKAP